MVTNAAAFLQSAKSFAHLSSNEVEALRPIVVQVCNGTIDKRALIDATRSDSRFDDTREPLPGEARTSVMSPLGLALAYLFNNFSRLYGKDKTG